MSEKEKKRITDQPSELEPVPECIIRVVGPITPEQWAAAGEAADKLPPIPEAVRDRLRLIFRLPG